jgi:hypothetical protein
MSGWRVPVTLALVAAPAYAACQKDAPATAHPQPLATVSISSVAATPSAAPSQSASADAPDAGNDAEQDSVAFDAGDAPTDGGTPQLREDPPSGSSGPLPPAVIQRIVRKSFGRIRLCYEQGLARDPKLVGRVTIRFVIDEHGAVASAADAGSTLPDPKVVSCVVGVFGGMSFPAPQGGSVTVKYPIDFMPGD